MWRLGFSLVLTAGFLSAAVWGILTLKPAQLGGAQAQSWDVLIGDTTSALNPAIQNQDVALVGYMVPLVLQGSDVSRFLLVPQAGQCLHVPPPPVNQTVLVSLDQPVALRNLYQPVRVAGLMQIAVQQTDLAEVGYELQAVSVKDFRARATPAQRGHDSLEGL